MESSRYQPPVRHSLSDAELSARVNQATDSHQGLESVMELLVTQEALRAQEDQELAAWVMEMESEGSQQSIEALANYRGQPVPDITPVEPEEPSFVEPVVETVVEPAVETVGEPVAASEPFSWFTKTDEVEIVTVDEPVDEVVEQVEVIEEVEVISEPSFVEEIEDVAFVEEPLHVEGAETIDEFEQLLVSAAAEEELTALEDSRVEVSTATKPSNVQVPTDENRNRKPISQLATWLGLSATVVPILLAFAMKSLNLTFTAALLDLALGYLVAGTLISVSALAGKRSGLSTATISRAVFGVWGNAVPLSFVLISRIVLTAIVVAVFALLMNGVEPLLPAFNTVLVSFAGFNISVGFLVSLALLVAAFLFALARNAAGRILQVLVSLLAFGFLVEGSFGVALQVGSPTTGTVGFASRGSLEAIALVAVVVTTLFISLAPNAAKAIPMKFKGSKVFTLVLVATFVIPFAIASVAALYFYSTGASIDAALGAGIATGPFAVLLTTKAYFLALPMWVKGAIGSSVALSLFYIVSMSLRTAAQDVLSLFRFRSKSWALVIALGLTALVLVLFSFQPERQTVDYLVNMFVLAGVLSVGWMSMFVADVAVRRIAYHELSLTRSYGFYGKFNVLSFVIWILVSAVAVLLVPVDLMGFSFTGTLASKLSLGDSAFLGLAVSFALGSVLTLAIRIPQIRKQEREVVEVESRREALNDIFVGQE